VVVVLAVAVAVPFAASASRKPKIRGNAAESCHRNPCPPSKRASSAPGICDARFALFCGGAMPS
jgi:hypothetical protein